MRLARFARVRLLRHAFPISLLILTKNTTVLQSTGPRRVLTGFPVHSLPVVPAGSLSSLLLLLVRKGKTPPLALRLCFTLGLPTTGLIAPGTCLDGNPIPGLSGALIELARLMLSGLSLVSNPLNVSALLGPFDPGPVTASDGVLPRLSLWGSSNEAPSNDTCWIAVTRDSLRTKDNYTQLKNEDSTVGTLYCNEIFLTTDKFLHSYTDLSMMKGSRRVPKALRHFQEFVGVEEYSFAITQALFLSVCVHTHACLQHRDKNEFKRGPVVRRDQRRICPKLPNHYHCYLSKTCIRRTPTEPCV